MHACTGLAREQYSIPNCHGGVIYSHARSSNDYFRMYGHSTAAKGKPCIIKCVY